MANESSDFQLFGSQNFQRGIEAHDEIVVGILIKYSDKRLLELGRSEAVGKYHMASCRVAQTLHLEESDLIETPCKDVDNVAVVGYSFRKVVIELLELILILDAKLHQRSSYLQSLLVVFNVVLVNIVVRTYWLS